MLKKFIRNMKYAFDIKRQLQPGGSFNAQAVIDQFSINVSEYTERFNMVFDMPDQWQVGLIVGGSGTGKTTIAREIFADEYEETNNADIMELAMRKSVIEAMPGKMSDIVKMFTSVGFSSPPSWLKPYRVLSNGEQMRVNLAYSLLSKRPLVVFDEFTSVVDRQVAKIASYCTQKAVRATEGKRFVAVTCHHDVEPWLMPDWTLNTDTMTFTDNRAFNEVGLKKNRPVLTCQIRRVADKQRAWNAFKKYHYLNHEHNSNGTAFTLHCNGIPAAFCSFIPFPHAQVSKAVRIHRLVVLPEYQGFGLGSAILHEIASMQKNEGYRVFITTTHPALKHSLSKSAHWILLRQGKKGKQSGQLKNRPSAVNSRYTTSWEFINL